jgi:hypothetical protein
MKYLRGYKASFNYDFLSHQNFIGRMAGTYKCDRTGIWRVFYVYCETGRGHRIKHDLRILKIKRFSSCIKVLYRNEFETLACSIRGLKIVKSHRFAIEILPKIRYVVTCPFSFILFDSPVEYLFSSFNNFFYSMHQISLAGSKISLECSTIFSKNRDIATEEVDVTLQFAYLLPWSSHCARYFVNCSV